MDPRLEMFANRLTKVFRHRSRQARKLGVSCYRVYDHDLPEFPFCLEFYGERLYAAEYLRRHGMDESAHAAWLDECRQVISAVLGIPPGQIHLRQRRRMAHRDQDQQYQALDRQQEFFTVQEDGLNFLVNLTDYLDSGLFLDHRITRKMVGTQSEGKRVLNLFCYTGSFSVYAAAGKAAQVISVDLSRTYLAWAENNFRANGIGAAGRYRFVHADVLQFLETQPPRSFDLIVLDPPTFSNSKRMKDFLDIRRDHPQLIRSCLRLLDRDGSIYFSTNLSDFSMDPQVADTADVRDITRATTPFDFEGKLNRWCYLVRESSRSK